MKLAALFRSYELLADRADSAFARMVETHGDSIQCERHCADCCHAVFGLFLIEAAYIQEHFSRVDHRVGKEVLLRAEAADAQVRSLQEHLRAHEGDPQMMSYVLARERVRCPFLDDRQDCVLYERRPITCRVYGIPTAVRGKARVCHKAGFRKGERYPVFDLDETHRDLYLMSQELLAQEGAPDVKQASLLISVSKAVRTPLKDLVKEIGAGNL